MRPEFDKVILEFLQVLKNTYPNILDLTTYEHPIYGVRSSVIIYKDDITKFDIDISLLLSIKIDFEEGVIKFEFVNKKEINCKLPDYREVI